MSHPRAVLWLMTTAVVWSVSACSGAAGATEGAAGAVAPTAQQRAQWALPLDPYIASPVTTVITDYAENLLVEQCMNSEGIDWPIPRMDVSTLGSATMSPSGRTLLTQEGAQQYGYHSDPILPTEVAAQMTTLGARQLNATETAAIDGCIATARQTLPLPQTDQLGAQLANQALGTAEQDQTVQEAAGRWRTCMAPQGVSDLPDAPQADGGGMPTDSMIAEFGIDDPGTEAGAAEIALAVADQACRTSSGYDDALYTAEWAEQSALLTTNADALVREGTALSDYLTQARAVIAERTGA
ncbi:MAG: hypothetical protein KJ548_06990 [Actinobacteria bacterium]|nr:hypothetical protein [Actinomycetota bacterium]MCG2799596.1 hypothetical protein [Cellulomonas sp.]